MRLANYHTHTTFCDGNDDPEAMVQSAITNNMQELGFSAHTAWPVATEWHLPPSRYGEYISVIRAMAEKYAGTITIRCGFEADYIPGLTAPDSAIYREFAPDYLIGSVHMVLSPEKKQRIWSVDGPVEEVAQGLSAAFRNNGKRAVQAYWAAVREMVQTCDFDIIGHLDLVRKRNKALRFFDETEPWYRREVAETVKVIARSGKIVELNTGGMARKAIDSIYPAPATLELLCKRDVPVTFSSDVHTAADILYGHETALQEARRAGYREITFLGSRCYETEYIGD